MALGVFCLEAGSFSGAGVCWRRLRARPATEPGGTAAWAEFGYQLFRGISQWDQRDPEWDFGGSVFNPFIQT